jgi:hypothetical protein
VRDEVVKKLAKDWSKLECESIVADYPDMLATECRNESFSKAEHRRLDFTRNHRHCEASK